jgi:hypothetical protein
MGIILKAMKNIIKLLIRKLEIYNKDKNNIILSLSIKI